MIHGIMDRNWRHVYELVVGLIKIEMVAYIYMATHKKYLETCVYTD